MEWFPLYDNNADKIKTYLVKCYDLDNKLVCYHITRDYEEVKHLSKVVKNCKVIEL